MHVLVQRFRAPPCAPPLATAVSGPAPQSAAAPIPRSRRPEDTGAVGPTHLFSDRPLDRFLHKLMFARAETPFTKVDTMTNRENLPDDVRDENPGAGEQAGEAIGGIGGALAGAGIGSAAGPIGTIIGGIAGAAGGWWAGEKVGRAAEDMGEHEDHYRSHYRGTNSSLDYDDARVGYGVGHIAGRNPEYRGREFDEVEPQLRSGWNDPDREYDELRPYVREGFRRTSKGDPMV